MNANNNSTIYLPKRVDNSHRLYLNGLKFNPDSLDNSYGSLEILDQYGEVGLNFNHSLISGQIVEVSADYPNVGNKRNSVSEALTYISANLNPNDDNSIQIFIYGNITESAQLLFPSHVHMTGEQGSSSLFLDTPLASGEAFLRIGRNNIMSGFTIDCLGNADYGLEFGFASDFGASGLGTQLTFANSNIAHLYAKQFNNYFASRFLFFQGEIARTDYAVYSNGGFIGLQQCGITNDTETPFTRFTAGYYSLNSNLPNATVALINRTIFRYCETGILLDNSFVDITNCEVRSNTTGFNLTNGSTLKSNNISFVLTGGIQLSVDSTSNYFSQACFHTLDSLNVANYDNVAISYLDRDPKNGLGQHYLGKEFFIGDRSQPVATYMGNGLSNPSGEIYLKYNGSTYIDATSDIQDSSITTTIFDLLVAGNIFYFGCDFFFTSSRFDVSQIITLGGGSVVFEYYNGSWVSANYMNAQAESPYLTYGNNVFNAVEIQDIRGDIFLSSSSTDWIQTTINGSNKYWARARITATITQSPTIDYAKLLSDTTIVSGDGNILHYGKSRTKKILQYDYSNAFNTGSTKPTNQDLYFGSNLYITRTFNAFGANDEISFIFYVPSDFDSSSEVNLNLTFSSSSTNASQPVFDFILYITVFDEGDQIFTASVGSPHKNLQTLNYTLTPNQTNGQFSVIQELGFYLPQAISSNNQSKANQLIIAKMRRPNTDSNVNNLLICQMSLFYISWRTTNIYVI